jgi:subtilisin family serine protease
MTRYWQRLKWTLLSSGWGVAAVASPLSSIDSTGIDAKKLQQPPYNLTGKKIAIGQVELGRPGYFRFDKAAARFSAFQAEQIFFRDEFPEANMNVDQHATMVASVMISRDKARPGVAPDARLYSTAVGTPRQTNQAAECLASQFIAQQNSNDVRAINFSFGEPLARDGRKKPILDGNALLTQCLDWSARKNNVLHLVAGNQGKGGIPIPTDNFNGLNVAYTIQRDGLFRKVDFANLSQFPVGVTKKIQDREINVGNRRSIGLVAPGSGFTLYGLEGKIITVNGTSFATPHATATVALLQEFGDRQLRAAHQKFNPDPLAASVNHWSLAARQHEVMKAVLMNSAEKIRDLGNGDKLNMSRTILSKDNRTWLEGDAYRDPQIPLDYQMGTGQLNAYRAYQQFSPGQWSPQTPVAPIAWDYNQVTSNAYHDYILATPLRAGSFVSATLAWDRLVVLNDQSDDGDYTVGKTFTDKGLNNLDIYLMRAEDTDTQQSIWSSVSNVDSVEHIFHQVPTTGRYKIRVRSRQQVNLPIQAYALAWWTVPAK